MGCWMPVLFIPDVGAPCGRGLTFFYSALGRIKESKQRKGDDGFG
jgi:hypothetical protein